MDNSLNISKDKNISSARMSSFIVLMIVCTVIGTFLRISLLIIYPLVVLFLTAFFRFRISNALIILLGLVSISFLFSFFNGAFLKYKLLSLFYMLPLLLLLFSKPTSKKFSGISHIALFIKCLTIISLVNNIIGFFQIFNNPISDDSFLGLYSRYSVSMNGLMLLNAVLFFYYFLQYLSFRKWLHLTASIFFLICSILGFYGAGLVICIAAFILCFLKVEIKAIIKTALIGLISIASIYLMLLWIKPLVLEYNLANIKKIISLDVKKGPRKLISFYNYGISYPNDLKDFLLGSGPGTFNSRSAFMVGSPSYFKPLRFIKDENQPYYFKNYAHTLWNEANTVQSLYLDGFRNQPFSSLLAFLGEYGLIFTIVFCLLYHRYYRNVAGLYKRHKENKDAEVYFRFFKFLILLLPLLFVIDNYFEYPEIMLLILLCLKFSHAELLNIKINSSYEH